MLKILRKHSRHWVIGLVIGAIVVVFIFWGMGTFRPSSADEVARVNGTSISRNEFYQFLSRLQRDGNIPGDLSDEARRGLKEMVRNELINQILYQQAAARLGIRVTQSELQEVIARDPRFQEGGRFSLRVYNLSFGPPGPQRDAKQVAFEEGLRRELLMKKLAQTVTSFAKVSEAELQEHFRQDREGVEVSFVVVSPESFASRVQPGEADLKAYFERHAQEFQTPEKVKARYLLVPFQDFQSKVEISPREVDNYLQDHGDELVRPKVIRVREVFLALPPKAGPADRQKLARKAQEVMLRAQKGEDFAGLARTLSQDEAGKQQGGDLGPVKRGQKPEGWEKVAFSLIPGQTGRAQTDKGFHIIQLVEITEKEPLPEGEARAKAAASLKEEKSRVEAEDQAKRLQMEMARASFPEVAKQNRLTFEETPLFTRTEAIPGLGLVRGFNEEAFKRQPQEVAVVELPQGFAVLQVLERQPAAALTFEQAKDRVRQAVVRQQSQKLAGEEAARLLARLRQGEPLGKAAAQAGLPLRDSGWFTRTQGFLQQPLAKPLTSAAFRLSDKQLYPPEPEVWQGKYYVLAFKARRLPSPEDFRKERDTLEQENLKHKRQVLFEAWLRGEWQRAKIMKNELPS